MVNYNAKIVKTENGTNASIIVTDSGNATQPMKTTTEMTTMATALSTSLGDLSDQENGTTGKCEKLFTLYISSVSSI